MPYSMTTKIEVHGRGLKGRHKEEVVDGKLSACGSHAGET